MVPKNVPITSSILKKIRFPLQTRLCTKVEPSDESLPSSVECLSALLRHEDSAVADGGALKCFASLADRFIRKNVDPQPLTEHGLTRELLSRLSAAAGPAK